MLETHLIEARRKHEDRWLTVINLKEVAERLGEVPSWQYVNNMQPGSRAGDHYHKKKSEVFYCVHGELTVMLQDIETNMLRKVLITANPDSGNHFCMVVIRPNIAHAVVNDSDSEAKLLVYSTGEPRDKSDDFVFRVIQ